MKSRGVGTVVVFASLAGWMPTPNMAAYTASKFAVVGFADTLAMELRGSGITVRCVCPGPVQTPMLNSLIAQGASKRLEKLARPVTSDLVLDAVEKSLATPRAATFVFPGWTTTMLWHVRRLAPRALAAAISVVSR